MAPGHTIWPDPNMTRLEPRIDDRLQVAIKGGARLGIDDNPQVHVNLRVSVEDGESVVNRRISWRA